MFSQNPQSPDALELARQNYTDINHPSVHARWVLYDFATDMEDTELVVSSVVDEFYSEVSPRRFLDLGASAGRFLMDSLLRYPDAEGIGIEPHLNQYDQAIEAFDEIDAYLKNYLSHIFNREVTIPKSPKVRMIGSMVESQEWANELEDCSVDVLTALFMLYHVPEQARISLYGQMKRLIARDGLIVITTSDSDNKPVHRLLEERIAKRLGVTPPPHMNAGFTTEKAEAELQNNFKHIYVKKQQGTIEFRDENGRLRTDLVEVYKNSMRSMRNQFNNGSLVDEVDYEKALQQELDQLLKDPNHKEYVKRAIFVVGDQELGRTKSDYLASQGFEVK